MYSFASINVISGSFIRWVEVICTDAQAMKMILTRVKEQFPDCTLSGVDDLFTSEQISCKILNAENISLDVLGLGIIKILCRTGWEPFAVETFVDSERKEFYLRLEH